MNHQDIENSKNISVIQEGGAVQIEGVKLQYVGDAFNSYNLTLNVLLPSNGTIDAVSINKNLKLKLRCNKDIIVYEENLPLCELNNPDPANPQGLCFQMYNDNSAQFIMYQYNDRSTIENPFKAVGKYNSSAFRTDYWDFDFFITTPASPLGNKQSLIEDIKSIKDAFDQFKQTNPDKPSYCILTLIPGGWVKVTIKGLRIQPDVSSINPPSLRLTFDIINDMESPSARTTNLLATECLKNVKKYGPTISDDKQMTINTSITVYNPISSQQSILEKFGTIVSSKNNVSSKNKSLYQLLYMYFFTGINCDNIRTKLEDITNAKKILCEESPAESKTESKKKLDNAIIKYSKIFNPSRVENFVYLFTQVMTILLDQAPTEIDIPRISRIVYIEMRVNSKRDDIIADADQDGGNNTIDNTVVSQEGGADDDYLAYAKIVPMQISERNTGPNDMIVTITQLTSNCNKTLMNDDDDDANDLDIKHDFNKINISVGDAIRFVKDGKIVYGIICGFKAGKKKHLGGESNTNIQDYWTSSASFVGEDAESELYKLKIDEIVSIINLRGIIYVEFEYEKDNGYPYCDSISNEECKGKIKFNCTIDKDLWMLPNGYNPSPVKSFAKGLSAFADSFKIGKSTPFGLGNYGKIQYSLRAYMTLDKVNLPSNFKEFSKDLKQLQPYGVNNNYIPQLGGLINKYSLNDDCGRYGMKQADAAILQTAANFLKKVDATTGNYFDVMRGGFDMKKTNNFIVKNLLNIDLTPQELKDTIYGANADQSKLELHIPNLIYGLMLRSPDYVTSMKLIFSALSDSGIQDDDIKGKINGIKGVVAAATGSTLTSKTAYSLGGGAASNVIKELIDALINIIKDQRLLRADIIDKLSSACDNAFRTYNSHDDSKSFIAELSKSLTPPTRPSRPGIVTSRNTSSTSKGDAIAPGSSGSASSGSASSSFSTSFNDLASRFMGTSGEASVISSMGSGSCGDAKVMCDNTGMIQVQIDLKDLLSNCLSSNGETGGTIVNPINFTPSDRNGSRLNSDDNNNNIKDDTLTKPPANITRPIISGDTKVGSILKVTTGLWNGSEEQDYTYEYQWYIGGVEISDAKTNEYRIVDDDIGKKITCKVTAINKEGVKSVAIESDNTIEAIAADEIKPENTKPITEDPFTIDSVRDAYTNYYGLYGKVAPGGGGGEGTEVGGGGGSYDFIQEGGTRFDNTVFQGRTAYNNMNDRTFNFNETRITTQMMNPQNLTLLKNVVDKMTTDGKDVDNRDPADSGTVFKGSNEIYGIYKNSPEKFPKTVIFTKNDIADSGKNIAEYLLKGNTELKELWLERCDLTEADIRAIMSVFLQEPPIALESLFIGGNPGLTVPVLLSMLDMFGDPKFSKNLKILNIIVAGSVGNRVSSTTIGNRDAENNVDEILKKSYGSSKSGSPIESFGDEFRSCLPGNNQENSTFIDSAKKRLTVAGTESAKLEPLKPIVTGKDYFEELKQAKAAYDASVTGAMPIATHIKIMENVVANFTPITPTSETKPAAAAAAAAAAAEPAAAASAAAADTDAAAAEPAADATVPQTKAKAIAHKAANDYLSELKSKTTSEEGAPATAVAFNADALKSATDTFTTKLNDIEQNYKILAPAAAAAAAAAAADTSKVSDTEAISEQDLNSRKDRIISGYNKMLDLISTAIDTGELGELCAARKGGNIADYIAAFNASIDVALSKSGIDISEIIENVKKIASKFIANIKANDEDKRFADIDLFCRIMKQQVEKYRSLIKTQLETEPPDEDRKRKYIEMIKGGTDAFITKILNVDVKLTGTEPTNYAFILVNSAAAPTAKNGGSNSSRKNNSRKKNHRKSSSKARKSRRNTRSSSTSKNHKKVRFVKTS